MRPPYRQSDSCNRRRPPFSRLVQDAAIQHTAGAQCSRTSITVRPRITAKTTRAAQRLVSNRTTQAALTRRALGARQVRTCYRQHTVRPSAAPQVHRRPACPISAPHPAVNVSDRARHTHRMAQTYRIERIERDGGEELAPTAHGRDESRRETAGEWKAGGGEGGIHGCDRFREVRRTDGL
ncbi:hypothetical protein OH76DRAFT_377213 [Lentinus brumalis]|uniref:Uncharacterized protein n=1 Tax=Lentinus brumalis TaxID=2498619 RepID=A0A371CIW9_9APHY|nr:hypothetical protein OH76DRAFT_377213 [Polyporus brumalis]